jgi:hypothetical protein
LGKGDAFKFGFATGSSGEQRQVSQMLLPKSVNNFVAYAQSYSTPVPANEPPGVRVGSPGTIEIELVESRELLI